MQRSRTPPVEQGVGLLRYVPANLRRLHVAGVLSEDAMFLALQLIAKMQAEGRMQITRTLVEAGRSLVYLDGKPYGGAVGSTLLAQVGALQQVHSLVGFFNHYAESGLDGADPETHFSNDPMVHFGVHWSEKTPIFFRFDEDHFRYWVQFSNLKLDEARKDAEVLNLFTER